jgi:hypothetical protein
MNPWIFLALAIALEVTGTFLLKLSNGFEKWQWGALSIFCYSACFWVLAPAMKALTRRGCLCNLGWEWGSLQQHLLEFLHSTKN